MTGALSDADRDRLRAVFDRHIEVGLHHGAQLAVAVDGELVVDFAGGTTGPDGEATTSDQRHVLFSCTKPYAGVAVHQLAEQGGLDYDDALVEHWPEFADAGTEKAEITVRHVLSHQAGIPYGEFDERPDLWPDWEAAVEAMEEIEPLFPPGEQPAYHALNYGWLVGELVRRVSGQPIAEYVEEHVFEPLGMDDTTLGAVDPAEVATLTGFDPFDRCREPGEGLEDPPSQAAWAFNQPEIQGAVMPAAAGIGSARDMARFYTCIASGGELGGTRILDAETVETALELQAETDEDATIGRPARYAMGFWKGGNPTDMFGTLSPERAFGHAGLGSVFGWGDPEQNVGFAYVTNGIREESFEHLSRVNAMTDAVRRVLD